MGNDSLSPCLMGATETMSVPCNDEIDEGKDIHNDGSLALLLTSLVLATVEVLTNKLSHFRISLVRL